MSTKLTAFMTGYMQKTSSIAKLLEELGVIARKPALSEVDTILKPLLDEKDVMKKGIARENFQQWLRGEKVDQTLQRAKDMKKQKGQDKFTDHHEMGGGIM